MTSLASWTSTLRALRRSSSTADRSVASIPTARATASAAARLSPLSITTRTPQRSRSAPTSRAASCFALHAPCCPLPAPARGVTRASSGPRGRTGRRSSARSTRRRCSMTLSPSGASRDDLRDREREGGREGEREREREGEREREREKGRERGRERGREKGGGGGEREIPSRTSGERECAAARPGEGGSSVGTRQTESN